MYTLKRTDFKNSYSTCKTILPNIYQANLRDIHRRTHQFVNHKGAWNLDLGLAPSPSLSVNTVQQRLTHFLSSNSWYNQQADSYLLELKCQHLSRAKFWDYFNSVMLLLEPRGNNVTCWHHVTSFSYKFPIAYHSDIIA